MKKLITLITTCLIAAAMIAQPTITESNNAPVVGDSYTSNPCNYIAPTSTGANAVWDYSTLTPGTATTVGWENVSVGPNSASFSDATVLYGSGSYYVYFSSSASNYSAHGLEYGGTIIAYDDPQIQLQYPCTLGTSWLDTFGATFFSGVTIVRSGTIQGDGVGYGTLTTPYGTYNDVMLIRYQEDYQDTYTGGVINYTSDVYVWYLAGTHYALLSMTHFEQDGIVTEYGQYLDIASPSVLDEYIVKDFRIYPNPASNAITIGGLDNFNSAIIVTIFNLNGQVVLTSKTNKIDTSNLVGGLYTVQTVYGETISYDKLIIAK